ncbi:WAT1-related protein At3g18200-like [Macadamia integrifolia]|uniref:WAT1-related protein At3g18200-like n=1 Tax=Macadamia integrifolia TaxID=60698 RepID=UPI001C502013|nr:WAT1-related protein At3g18200-like [Macadamia integrifolia]
MGLGLGKGNVAGSYKIYMVMTLSSLTIAGYIVLLHSYISTGASASVLVFYQHVVATSLLFSLAFIFERKRRPPLTLQTISLAFLLGLLQIPLGKLLLTWSLRFISATCQSVALNSKTALVFILAVAFQRESFSFFTVNGQAKLWGITLSGVGTTIMILWRGPATAIVRPEGTFQGQFIGWLMTGASLLSLSFANLLVEDVAAKYRGVMSWVAMISFWGTIQTATVAAFTERDLTAWKIQWEGSLQVLLILYGGVLVTGLCFYVTSWCIYKKGSVFASAFHPLNIVFSFFLETIILRKAAQFGSIAGAILVTLGLYLLLWAKSNDTMSTKLKGKVGNSTLDKHSHNKPLLRDELNSSDPAYQCA